jgi:5'-nucleotidase
MDPAALSEEKAPGASGSDAMFGATVEGSLNQNGISPRVQRPSFATNALASLRNMRHVGAAAVAASKLLKIMPGTTIEVLAERIDVSRLDVFLDRLTRFFYRCKGKLMITALREQRAAAAAAASWDRLLPTSIEELQQFSGSHEGRYDIEVVQTESNSWKSLNCVELRETAVVFLHVGGGIGGALWLSEIREIRRVGQEDVEFFLQTAVKHEEGDVPEITIRLPSGSDASEFICKTSNRLSNCLKLSTQSLLKLSSRTITIVHFNDVYHLNPFKNPDGPGVVGGAARFLTKLKEIQSVRNPLVLFSGDFMGPSLMSVLMKGKQMVDAFNLIGVHYGTFGNHEFDYGLQPLVDCVHGQVQGNFVFAGSNTKWIMTNMSDAKGNPLAYSTRYETLVWNGIKVGILGLSENWLPSCNQLTPQEAFYSDCFEEGERYARMLKRNEGCEIVIALTHSRYQTDKEMAMRCPTIDLILGGHDHFYKNSPQRRIVKSGEEFEFLTEIVIRVPAERHQQLSASVSSGGALIKRSITTHPITLEIVPDAHMMELIARYEKRLQQRMGKVIGITSIPLDCTEACCRFKEGCLPNFFVDVMAERAGADFAILGGAAIAGKAVMAPGDITLGDVFNWFPNDTRVMTVRLLGSTVIKMLTVMVKDVPDEAPSFPHPSAALNFTINTLRTPTSVQNVTVRGEPIELDTWYTVAVEDFVGLGKAKYKFIPVEGQMVCDDEAAEQITFWIIEYFEGRKKLLESDQAEVQDDFDTDVSMRQRKSITSMRIDNARQRLKSDAQLDGSESSRRASTIQPTSWMNVAQVLDGRSLARVMEETSKFGNVTSLGLVALCEHVCYAVQRLVPSDFVRLVYFDDVARMAWCVLPVCKFVPAKRASTDPFRGSYVVAREEGKPVIITDFFDDPRYDRKSERHARGARIRNIMSVPVGIYEDRYSACVIQCFNRLGDEKEDNEAAEFSSHDSVIATLFLTQAAPLIQLACAREEREAVEQQQHLLLNAATEILGNKDLSVIKLNEQIVVINNHANIVFGCKSACFYVLDAAVGEVWTVQVGSKKSELVVDRKNISFNKHLADAVETKQIVNSAPLALASSVSIRAQIRQSPPELAIPVFAPQSENELLGVLLLQNRKTDAQFSAQDMIVGEHFSSFAAVAVQTSNEVEVLRTGVNRSTLRPFPILPLGRIRFLRGWGSVRKLLKVIISKEFIRKLEMADDEGHHGPEDLSMLMSFNVD